MNHDYVHCLAADSRCPKDCFRYQLAADLQKRIYLLPVAWSNFEGTAECMRKGRKHGLKDGEQQ